MLFIMALSYFVCTNCGFWQQHFDLPTRCPVCEDVRHTPPESNYFWLTPPETNIATDTSWHQVARDVVVFNNAPQLGLGPVSYLMQQPDGNILFEGTVWYSDAALEQIAALGGVRWIAASHPHAYGALWRVQERFQPEVAIQVDDLVWTNAMRVTWPWDERLELAPGVELLHTGGHFPGHAVLFDRNRCTLFAGDALKFHYNGDQLTGISCHKAFNRQIPLSHGEIRRYREVIGALDFDHVFTSFEDAPVDRDAVLRLFDARLTGRPTAEPLRIT